MRRPSHELTLDIIRHGWVAGRRRHRLKTWVALARRLLAATLVLVGLGLMLVGLLGRKEHRNHGTQAISGVVSTQCAESQGRAGIHGMPSSLSRSSDA